MAKHVTTGEKFRFGARTYNELNDLIEKDRAGNLSMNSKAAGSNNDCVLVKNLSGVDVPRFGVLGIEGILFDPQTALPAFTARTVFTGILPAESHQAGRFLICAEPIANGTIGRAWADGIVTTRIWVQDESHQYATAKTDDVTQLASADQGLCYILYKEAGTGQKWAVMRIGCCSPIRMAYCKIDAGTASTIQCCLDTPGTGRQVTVYCQISGGFNLNEAIPRLSEGHLILVTNVDGLWHSLQRFQASEDCS